MESEGQSLRLQMEWLGGWGSTVTTRSAGVRLSAQEGPKRKSAGSQEEGLY